MKKIKSPVQLSNEPENSSEEVNLEKILEEYRDQLMENFAKQIYILSSSEPNEIKTGICEFADCYLEITSKSNKDNDITNYFARRISNFKISPKKNIVLCDINYPNNAKETELELIVENINGQRTNPIRLSGLDKKSPEKFREKIYSYGNFADCFTPQTFSQLFDMLYKEDIEVVYEYFTPGFIPDKNIWLMGNAVIDIETGTVIRKEV